MPVLSRIVAGVLGGYGLALLTSLAVLALPTDRVQTVLSGMMLALLVHAAAIIWAFAARNAYRVWAGMLLVALPLAVAAWSVCSEGACT